MLIFLFFINLYHYGVDIVKIRGINPKVLIVEDESIIYLHFKDMLELWEYAVIGPAMSGHDAISYTERENPDIILMDINLDSNFDGIQAVEIIQKRFDIPIIYITSSTNSETLERAKRTAPYAYLVKPINDYDLRTTIETVLARYALEKKIKETEEFSTSLLEYSPNPILVLNQDSSVKYANPAIEKLTGYPAKDLIGQKLPSEWQNKYELNNAINGELKKSEIIIKNKNGKKSHIIINFAPVYTENKFKYLLAIWVDISLQKELQKQILDISDKERIRIGTDLHDGIGQYLTGISYLLSAVNEKVNNNEQVSKDELSKIIKMIDETKTHMRMISKGLVPVYNLKNGLMLAIQELCGNIEYVYGVKCPFACNINLEIKNNSTSTHIYYIILEAITNSIKHGNATKIIVEIKTKKEDLLISILDNGTGINNSPNKNSGIGMDLMRYRADLISGEITFKPGKNGGTRVSCMIPDFFKNL